jgi:hypothetical protein
MTVGSEYDAAQSFLLCLHRTGSSWSRTPLPLYGSGGLAAQKGCALVHFPAVHPRDLHQLRRRHLEDYITVV